MPFMSIVIAGSGKYKADILQIIGEFEMRNSRVIRLTSNQGATRRSHGAHMCQSCGNDELHNARFVSFSVEKTYGC